MYTQKDWVFINCPLVGNSTSCAPPRGARDAPAPRSPYMAAISKPACSTMVWSWLLLRICVNIAPLLVCISSQECGKRLKMCINSSCQLCTACQPFHLQQAGQLCQPTLMGSGQGRHCRAKDALRTGKPQLAEHGNTWQGKCAWAETAAKIFLMPFLLSALV